METEKEVIVKPTKSTQGKKNRAAGARFELKVRSEMEKMGWIVSKWMNTIDYQKNKVVPAKRKFNPFIKALSMGTGFPDFVCFRKVEDGNHEVIGLEVKKNGYLDQVEKGMCHWYIDHKIFNRILIAKIGKSKEMEFVDFKEKYKVDSEEQ